MVQVLSTSIRENSVLVELELKLISLDSNSNGSLSDGSLKLVNIVVSDINKVLDFTNSLRGLILACSISGGISVIRLELKRIRLNIFESQVHETSITPLIPEGASTRYKLLFRERDELATLDKVSTFQGSSSRERPTASRIVSTHSRAISSRPLPASTLSLVLDRGDGTLGRPIDRIYSLRLIKVFHHEFWFGKSIESRVPDTVVIGHAFRMELCEV